MAGCLHQILSSDPRVMTDCLEFIQAGDEVLLVDNGVTLLLECPQFASASTAEEAGFKPSALHGDAKSRGLEASAQRCGVELINDQQWIDRVCSYSQVLSWK